MLIEYGYVEDPALAITDVGKFFEDILLIEPECRKPGFVKYLEDTQALTLTPSLSRSSLKIEYELDYYARPVTTEEGITVRPARSFETKGGVFADPNDWVTMVEDIRARYDEYRNNLLRRRVKRAGIVGGLALVVGAVATGLSLGLKRAGTDFQRDSQIRAKTLRPSTPKTPKIPWTNLESATGKAIVWSSENLVLIGVVGFALLRGR